MTLNTEVDKFVKKAKTWQAEIIKLRGIMLGCGLEEEFKWSKPCYGRDGTNVAIIQPFKNCLALMFFKGTLLKDPKNILRDVGPNSQAARRMEFTSSTEISKLAPIIKSYLKEAVALEKAGKKVTFKKQPEALPEELKAMFAKKPAFRKAFEKLTPGRQRAYILQIAGAKQSATRQARIEKFMPAIMAGKGLNDR